MNPFLQMAEAITDPAKTALIAVHKTTHVAPAADWVIDMWDQPTGEVQ